MNGDQMLGEMTPYDRKAWDEIERWRAKRLAARMQRGHPEGARERLSDGGQKVRTRVETVPGSTDFQRIFLKSLEELVELGGRAVFASVSKGAVVQAYRKHDAYVDDLGGIRNLDLSLIDKVKPRLGLRYTAVATAEGAGAGFTASGGGALVTRGTIAHVGADGAPGAALVIGTIEFDAAAVLMVGQRAVAHIGAYYGYDAEQPDELRFVRRILSRSMSYEAEKIAAYMEINKLVQALARNAKWEQLNKSGVTQVVEKVFARLESRLTKKKLGQAVPVMGTAIGAGANALLLRRITDDAEHLYRERFLRERYGIEAEPSPATANADSDEELDIVDAEIVDEDNERGHDEPTSSAEGGERG